MIVLEDIHKHFGGFRAVDGTSLEIKEGSITGLISTVRGTGAPPSPSASPSSSRSSGTSKITTRHGA